MSITHKFLTIPPIPSNTIWDSRFYTENCILKSDKYKAEIIILGTFNPQTPNSNHADFFYGRNFFWRAFKNMFIYNAVVLQHRRMPQTGAPAAILDPTLNEIFDLCLSLKLTFSDLIVEVFHNGNPQYELTANDNVIFEEKEYNLIQDGKKGNINGLQQLDIAGQINWNTDNIIKYLCDNPQIRSIYFTRRPIGIWAEQWNKIISHESIKGRNFTNIFTPSGQGRPVFHSMNRLLNNWVYNENSNFGCLDKCWLVNNGVDPNNF